MGTRRSKHNKGRKPLYKEHGTETARHFDFEAAERKPREKIVPIVRNRKARPAAEVALTESVARYLANRPKNSKVDFADQPVPMADIPERQQWDISHLNSNEDGKLVAPSERDILLQLYVERKISGLQLRAGRAWQWDMEAAAIQPNMSIDWATPRIGLHYQTRGDLTERQYQAMARRREFQRSIGTSALRMLDFCLDVDRGRADLIFWLQCAARNVDGVIRQLLDTLAAAQGVPHGQRRVYLWRSEWAKPKTTDQSTSVTSRKSSRKIPVTFSQPRKHNAAWTKCSTACFTASPL